MAGPNNPQDLNALTRPNRGEGVLRILGALDLGGQLFSNIQQGTNNPISTPIRGVINQRQQQRQNAARANVFQSALTQGTLNTPGVGFLDPAQIKLIQAQAGNRAAGNAAGQITGQGILAGNPNLPASFSQAITTGQLAQDAQTKREQIRQEGRFKQKQFEQQNNERVGLADATAIKHLQQFQSGQIEQLDFNQFAGISDTLKNRILNTLIPTGTESAQEAQRRSGADLNRAKIDTGRAKQEKLRRPSGSSKSGSRVDNLLNDNQKKNARKRNKKRTKVDDALDKFLGQ